MAGKLLSCFLFIVQQSWSDKMVTRVRNVIKWDSKAARQTEDRDATPTPKHRKKEVELLRRYPVTNNILQDTGENPESLGEHKKAIEKELAKKKPRDAVLLPLMKSTYGDRRIYILNVTCRVSDLLEMYPALSRPAVVCMLDKINANTYKPLMFNRWNKKWGWSLSRLHLNLAF